MQGVRTTHPDYDALAPRWVRARDIIAGEAAMQAARERYLPALKDEELCDYDARLKRSDFFNATWRTIDALTGMAFRKPPQATVPPGADYLDDITLSGVTLDGFARECCEEILSVGRVGVLVDYPAQTNDGPSLTVAAAQALGMRPTLQIYAAEAIRNWRFERVNNAWALTQVVLGESEAVATDEFTRKPEARYRVLDLEGGQYRQRIFKVEEDRDILLSEVYPLMNGAPLSFIPFLICGPQGKGDGIDLPPLIDLIDKNVAHYQVNSDYRHALHTTALPTLFIAGLQVNDGDKIRIGGSSAIVAPDPNAKGEFIEYKGLGLKPISDALTRLETQMALLGARMIADETNHKVETLGATQIKRQGENSVLSKIVLGLSETLERALEIFSQWAGAAGVVEYHINRDFAPAAMDGRELMALVAAVQAGALSDREFFDLMQRGDVVDPATTFEQHQEEIRSQPSTIAAPAAPMPDNKAAA